MATDPRDHHHHWSQQLGTAAKQTNELDGKAQANDLISLNGHVGSSAVVVVVSKAASGLISFRRSRGIADHHHHHRGE